ncbi:MAG: FAD-dependent oxidoreductase, partial [Victivallaceae bacterium]
EKFQKLYSIHYAPGESYGIPYRSLVVKSFDNMLVAGRCVSSDQYMQASVRTMPGCYILGQAAGLAAALAVAKNGMVRDIDVKELQRGLKKMGAFLPNFNE